MRTLPSARHQAGAVNVMWLVVMMILLLASLGALYFQMADIENIRAARQEAIDEKLAAETKFENAFQGHQALTEVVGYRDASITGSTSDVASIRTELETVKTLIGPALGGPDTKVTLDQAIKALVSELQSERSARAKADADFRTELAARQAAESAINDVRNTFQTRVDSLESDLRAEQDARANQERADQRRHDDLIAENKDADEARREAEDRLREIEAQAARDLSNAEATIAALKPRREPVEPEQPDGEILSVDASGRSAYIDIGGKHGLKVGTKFELLRRLRDGSLVSRGNVEVREVLSDMALVAILSEPNPYDPTLSGDVVRNPHFAKNRSLNFYLHGEFPLAMSKEYVAGKLQELGAGVTDSVGTSTDVLVLGHKNLALGDDAPELTDTPEFMQADRLGIRVVRLDDLARFLAY